MITNLFSNHPSFPNSNSWLTDDWKSEIIIINPILKFQRLDNPNLAFGINPGDGLDLIININNRQTCNKCTYYYIYALIS